ncbi:MAG: inositol monophosphatase family protein, partial [Pseudomonadota bacterium]
GTNGFIAGNDQFAITLALMHDNKPIFGIILQPVTNECYFSWEGINYICDDKINYRALEYSPLKSSRRVLMGDRGKMSDVNMLSPESVTVISSSIKYVYLITNKADIYPSLYKTMAWDIAAGDSMLQNIGGGIYNLDSSRKTYDIENLTNNSHVSIRCNNIKKEICDKLIRV